MRTKNTWVRRLSVAALAAGTLIIPVTVRAQETPSYAQSTTVSTDETIHGRIASVDGAFSISIDDDRGFVDNVSLHQGTIINPTGLSLAPGMSVTISGYNAGSVFDANEIDTPYNYGGPLPTPVYYGPGYWCPGFSYGYGPSFSLAIIIGGGDRFEHRPFYGRPWDGHRYFGAYVGREYTGAEHLGYAHAPPAFAGHSFAGRPYAEHAFAGRPYAEHGFAGQANTERSFAGRTYPERSFSERGYASPGRAAVASPAVRSFGGGRTYTQSYARAPASAPSRVWQNRSFGGGAPAGAINRGGGFARSSGGFARGNGGGEARRSAGRH